MILLLLIPILVSGYVVFNTHPEHKYKLHRFDGQLLYIKTISFGLFCTSTAILLVSVIEHYLSYFSFTDYLNNQLFISIDSEYRSKIVWLFFVLVMSYAVAYTWCTLGVLRRIYNAFSHESSPIIRKLADDFFLQNGVKGLLIVSIFYPFVLLRFIFILSIDKNLIKKTQLRYRMELMKPVLADSPMDKIFFESYKKETPLMMTLEDKKVYVGVVISLGEPTENQGMDQEIKITPFLSGYRTKDTFEVYFNTAYIEIDSDIGLVIRQDKIVSVTHFDYPIFDEFKIRNKRKVSREGYKSMLTSRIARN